MPCKIIIYGSICGWQLHWEAVEMTKRSLPPLLIYLYNNNMLLIQCQGTTAHANTQNNAECQ